jgi:biotin-dependent carboxylase-like uncharacterized protein
MRWLEVLDPGLLSTCQDNGRPGLAHLGVPRSGALDMPAYALANRLVGNDAGAAVIETTFGDLRLRASAATAVAVTGALAEVAVGGRAQAWGEALAVAAGEVVEVAVPRSGVRSYLAAAGGIAVSPVLGSRSRDLLGGIGPPPLRAGDRLPLGEPPALPAAVDVALFRTLPDPLPLRFCWGPRDQWFSAAARAAFTDATFAVTPQCNRVAVRLSGPVVRPEIERELPSEGLVLGAVQVSADGQPLVFLADHPTTGGYPVIGVVVGEDVAGCAQLAPGDRVQFRPAP